MSHITKTVLAVSFFIICLVSTGANEVSAYNSSPIPKPSATLL